MVLRQRSIIALCAGAARRLGKPLPAQRSSMPGLKRCVPAPNTRHQKRPSETGPRNRASLAKFCTRRHPRNAAVLCRFERPSPVRRRRLDWLADVAVNREPVSTPNSLLTSGRSPTSVRKAPRNSTTLLGAPASQMPVIERVLTHGSSGMPARNIKTILRNLRRNSHG